VRSVAELARASLLAGAVLVAAASPAAAAPSAASGLDVTVEGGGSPFDLTGVHPGYSSSATVVIENTSDAAAVVALLVEDLASDDNGCNDPESAVDASCGDGEGELADQLLLEVERGPVDGGEQILAPTPLSALVPGQPLEGALGAGERRTYVLTLQLPSSSGNETQTDSADFDLVFSSSGADLSPALVAGARRSRPTDSGSAVLGAQVTTGARLPTTGSDVIEVIPFGVAGIAVGTSLTWIDRRRRG
jgi:hypothetical protein